MSEANGIINDKFKAYIRLAKQMTEGARYCLIYSMGYAPGPKAKAVVETYQEHFTGLEKGLEAFLMAIAEMEKAKYVTTIKDGE